MALNRDSENGFTLLEVLVSVALLALLAILLVPAIRAVSLADTRIRTHVETREAGVQLEALLRDALTHLQPVPEAIGAGALQGAGDSLVLSVRMPSSGRLEQLAIHLDGDAVVVSLSGPGAEIRTTRLTGFGRSTRFYFFGETEARDALAWHTEWPYNHLPRLVVLDTEPVRGMTRRLEMEVPAQAEFDCQFDSGLGVCLGGGP